jgi:hypothetical protein
MKAKRLLLLFTFALIDRLASAQYPLLPQKRRGPRTYFWAVTPVEPPREFD